MDVPQMLQEEIQWLRTVSPPPSLCPEFQSLLAGHLRLCQSLLTCEGTDKKESGRQLVQPLIAQYLFPASKMITESQEPRPAGILSINPM